MVQARTIIRKLKHTHQVAHDLAALELSPEAQQDLLAWWGGELKRRHRALHARFPKLPPRAFRVKARRRAA